MQHFNPTELVEHLKENTPLLLDVREPWEYKICNIEGSTLIPMHQIPNQMDSLDINQSIVLICHHGIRSRQVGLFLESNGYTNVINLTGGVDAWSKQVDPLMETY